MPASIPLDPLPDELSSPLQKLVYLYVRERGQATVYDLRDALAVPQLRLYPTLESLRERELIEHRGDQVWLPPQRGPDS